MLSQTTNSSQSGIRRTAVSLRFSNEEIQLSGRRLFVGGQPVLLGARAFDVLSLLMQHPGRVVTKKELLEAAWPSLIVEENNLQVQISTLRKVLGHDSITTIPGQGYQFTAPFSSARGTPPAPSDTQPEPQTAPPSGQAGPVVATDVNMPPAAAPRAPATRRRAGLALALAVLLASGMGAWRLHGAMSPDAASALPGAGAALALDRSVAVLPFMDMSEKKDLEYFSDGLSEEVMHLLSRVPELHVAARTSSFSFKGRSVDLPTIARELQVANVLEGSVRRSGNDLRITAQLVRADNGYQLWSQTYDRKLGEIFRIQEEIAASVAQALHLSLMGESLPKATATKSMDAYNLYLQGRSLQLHASTQADWENADEYARRAVSADVTFAPAWAFFSRVLSTRAQLGYIPSENGWEAARQAALRSLALDPGLREGHIAMASILIRHDWNWAQAQTQIEGVLQQEPANAHALSWAGYLALALGQKERAIAFYENAIGIDPLDPNKYNQLGHSLYLNGRFAEARIVLRKAVALDSGQPSAHWTLARMALAGGDPAAALVELEREPYEVNRLVGRAIAYQTQGRRSESDAMLTELERKYARIDAADIAIVHAYRGEIDQAFAWLDRGFQQRDTDCVFVQVEPLLENLRSDPRYQVFLRKMKLQA